MEEELSASLVDGCGGASVVVSTGGAAVGVAVGTTVGASTDDVVGAGGAVVGAAALFSVLSGILPSVGASDSEYATGTAGCVVVAAPDPGVWAAGAAGCDTLVACDGPLDEGVA
jgi:hypothetical protein